MPLRSEDAEAAVGDVLATVLVLVSVMWILETGMPKQREATYKRTSIKVTIRQTKNKPRPGKINKEPTSSPLSRKKWQDVTSVKRRKLCKQQAQLQYYTFFSRWRKKLYDSLRSDVILEFLVNIFKFLSSFNSKKYEIW